MKQKRTRRSTSSGGVSSLSSKTWVHWTLFCTKLVLLVNFVFTLNFHAVLTAFPPPPFCPPLGGIDSVCCYMWLNIALDLHGCVRLDLTPDTVQSNSERKFQTGWGRTLSDPPFFYQSFPQMGLTSLRGLVCLTALGSLRASQRSWGGLGSRDSSVQFWGEVLGKM